MKKRWMLPVSVLLAVVLLAGCRSTAQKMTANPRSNAAAQQSAAADTTPSATLIGRQEAIRIALEHAQVIPEEAKFVKAELDRDRGQDHYEVEFYHNGYEYDYKIHAHTGQILLAEKERA